MIFYTVLSTFSLFLGTMMLESNVIHINITLSRKQKCCPVCGSIHSNVKDCVTKSITHSIFNSNKTIIIYRARRFICLDCHKTFYEDNPFISQKHRISNATIFLFLKTVNVLTIPFLLLLKKQCFHFFCHQYF